MNIVETEKRENDRSIGYPFRTFNISMRGLREHVGHFCAPVHVLRPDMETIEEVRTGDTDWTGECVAVMFYNSVVYLDVPGSLGIKTSWDEICNVRVSHCALLEGFDRPVYWNNRESHPNYKAHNIGFDFGSEQKWGCINGKPIDWFRWTDSISGLDISVYENGDKITPEKKTGCYMCANNMEIHLEDAKRRAIGDFDNRVSYIDSLIVKLEEEIDGLMSHKEYLEKAKVGMQSLSPKEIWDKYPEFRR